MFTPVNYQDSFDSACVDFLRCQKLAIVEKILAFLDYCFSSVPDEILSLKCCFCVILNTTNKLLPQNWQDCDMEREYNFFAS